MLSIDDVSEARKRIAGVASQTPLVESPALSQAFGGRIFLKLECFQPTKVFKIRGAYNKISRVPGGKVVAASSGNHGVAVAYVSRLLGKQSTIVVPENAVKEKVDTIKEYGAEVLKFGRFSDDRVKKAREIAAETSAVFIHPFDDPDIIAGQGTIGIEIVEQMKEVDSVVVPVGGGGLISGIATAVKSMKPSAKVFGSEPTGSSKLGPALKNGHIVRIEHPRSIADGLRTNSLGQLPFKICRRLVDGAFEVSEDQILRSMKLLAREHVFAEPSAAVPLAALFSKSNRSRMGQEIVLVISGGNVAHSLLKKIL